MARIRTLGLVATAWIGLAFIAAVSFRIWPTTWAGVLVLLALGPPAYLLVSYLVEGTFGRLLEVEWIRRAPSVVRILYGVVLFTVPVAGLIAMAHWLKGHS